MFNVVSLICFFILSIITIANFALGYPIVGLWTMLMVPVIGVLYYLSRFTKYYIISIHLFAALSYVLMIGVYLLNSGIEGPAIYGFLLTFLIIILITPPKTHLIWFFLHTTVVLGLFVLEASDSSLVSYQYNSTFAKATDHSLTYIPVLLFIYVSGIFLRKSYNAEKTLATERLAAINQQKQDLEFINREKDRLFSIIGHDLRSPINAIQGYLEVLNATDLSSEDRTEIQKQLHDLTSNTSNLLNNLLLWSSKSVNNIKLESLNLSDTATEVIQLMLPQAYKKGLEITHELPIETYLVDAEKDMLQLVIRNIVSNAIKFTPEKGKIKLGYHANDTMVSIYIEDNGTGIPKDRQEDIFSSRAKSTRGTEQEPGVGLGLVLCHEFVNSMGGSISFESTENIGSTFKVSLKNSRA